MARKQQREAPTRHQELVPLRERCESCGGTLWIAYHSIRTITTLDGLCQLLLTIRRCHNAVCQRYRCPYRPEEEGRWALPHGEFGLDIIALIGTLRYKMHHSVPEIHQELCKHSPQIQVIATFENASHDERETKSKRFVEDETNRVGLTA